jgi:hypothetical protein
VLVGNHLLLRDFGPYGIFMNLCVVLTVAMVTMLRNCGHYGIILWTFMAMYVSTLDFLVILDEKFNIFLYKIRI